MTPDDDRSDGAAAEEEQTRPGPTEAESAAATNDPPPAEVAAGPEPAPPESLPDDPAADPVSPPGEFDEAEVTNQGPSPFQVTVDMAAADFDEPGTTQYTPATDPGLGAGGAAPPAPEEPVETPPAATDPGRLPSILESLLLVADRPLTSVEMATLVGEPHQQRVEEALQSIAAGLEPRGIQLHPVAGGWQLRTNPLNAPWVQKLISAKPVRLTRAQLETLAIIGYRQPITRPEIDEIRGVDSGGTLKTLLDRALVRILGKKEEAGRPLLYGTTKEFLGFFNLRDLRDLPTLREFHELTEEHQAQVAALEGKAAPGTIEPAGNRLSEGSDPGAPAPLDRVDLPEVPEEDLSKIDSLIDAAGQKAQAAVAALGGPATPGTETASTGPETDTDE